MASTDDLLESILFRYPDGKDMEAIACSGVNNNEDRHDWRDHGNAGQWISVKIE